MVILKEMNKPTLKVSVSDSESEDQARDEDYEGEVSDASSEDDQNSNQSDNEVMMTNEGWADSVAKILGSKKPKNKKTLVLSRAKKHSDVIQKVKEEKPTFEIIGDSGHVEEKPEVIKEESEVVEQPVAKKKKIDRPSIRMKPNILEKDREKLLTKIATKGVVQLFNAVRNQQKTLEKELDKDITEGKKEKIMKKFDKRSFLDTLMGQTKSVVVDQEAKSLKNEIKPEDEKPRWSALRDDFMMGAKMKDWDKESVEE